MVVSLFTSVPLRITKADVLVHSHQNRLASREANDLGR